MTRLITIPAEIPGDHPAWTFRHSGIGYRAELNGHDLIVTDENGDPAPHMEGAAHEHLRRLAEERAAENLAENLAWCRANEGWLGC